MSSNNGSGTTINTGGGGAAGGVAVGTSDTRAASEVVVDVVVIFVAIAVGVLAIVLVVYFMSVVFDKYCCCFPWFMTVGDHTQEFDHGPIARKAGLWGLRREERMAILEKLLPGKPYSKDMASGSKTTSCDIESPRKARRLKKDKADNNKALRKKGLDTSERSVKSAGSEGESGLFSLLRKKSATTPSADVLNASRHSKKEHGDEEEGQAGEADAEESAEEGDELEDMLDEAEHDTTCAICLNDYEEGELVLTGQNCNHMFRRSCALEWLEKHDHCPYCREEMVTPQSMKSMALTVLGAQRVQQMTMWTNNAGVEVPTVTTAAAATATTNDTAATTTTTTTTTITITTTTPGQAARTTTAHDVVITSSSLPATASNNADGAAAEEDEEPQQPTTTATTGDEEEKETVDETDKVNKDAPKAFELQGQEEESTAVEEENEPDRISESIKEEETKKKETQDGKVQD